MHRFLGKLVFVRPCFVCDNFAIKWLIYYTFFIKLVFRRSKIVVIFISSWFAGAILILHSKKIIKTKNISKIPRILHAPPNGSRSNYVSSNDFAIDQLEMIYKNTDQSHWRKAISCINGLKIFFSLSLVTAIFKSLCQFSQPDVVW